MAATLPAAMTAALPTAAPRLPVDKIYWHGRHATFGYSSPLGKLP